MAFATGIGLVYNPLTKPALPTTIMAQGTTPSQILYLQTTWINGQGGESAPSDLSSLTLDGATTVTVSASGPALIPPSTAIGWNLYAANSAANLELQNDVPNMLGSSWHIPETGLVNGRVAGSGQVPDVYLPLAKKIQRG